MRHIVPLSGFLLFLGASIAALTFGADAFARAQERSQLHRYFADALENLAKDDANVVWKSATQPLVRPFTEVDEAVVGTAVGKAWRAHAAAVWSNDTTVLPDYFSGVALHRAQLSARMAQGQGVGYAVLSQEVKPTFYHLDGSVLQLEAEALSVRFAVEGDELAYFDLRRDRATTTLMNETTGWRVFSHELLVSDPVQPAKQNVRHPGTLVGVNYYPAKTPWRRFWPEFDSSIVEEDLELIADLGANAVRIFLPLDEFTHASTDTLNNLATFLDLADKYGLRVVPTLFDLRRGYEPSLWSGDAKMLQTVLPQLAGSDAVAFVDLKNEPDQDFEAHGTALVEAWLRTMAALCREIAPDLPLTVGWSDAAPAAKFTDFLDVLSYHDYTPVHEGPDHFDMVSQAARGKPVYVTEIGASSYNAAFGLPGSPAKQSSELAARFVDLRAADGVFVWTLHDFEQPDALAVGSSPWTQRLQAKFGLIDGTGALKASAYTVKSAFRTHLTK